MSFLTFNTLIIIIVIAYQTALVCSLFVLKEVPELIALRGFKHETHTVTTEDGFFITVHRIINPYIKDRPNLKPILFIHPFLVNGAVWLINGDGWLDNDGVYKEYNGDEPILEVDCDPQPNQPNVQTHGFALSACGYDVWLLSYRGTKYSKKHQYKNQDDSDFWHFSFQEAGMYDLPATIDYILNKTNKKSLSTFSHSQGTTVTITYLAIKPGHAKEKVNMAIIASPSVYMGSFFKNVAGEWIYKGVLYTVIKLLNMFILKFFDWPMDINGFLSLLRPIVSAGGDSMLMDIYKAISSFIMERISLNGAISMSQWNMAYWSQCVDVAIPYQFSHYLQLALKDDFVFHDRGDDENMQAYNQIDPPKIPLDKIIHEKIVLILGDKDFTSGREDIDRFKKVLKVPVYDDVEIPEMRHVDLTVGSRVGTEIITRVLRWLKNA